MMETLDSEKIFNKRLISEMLHIKEQHNSLHLQIWKSYTLRILRFLITIKYYIF